MGLKSGSKSGKGIKQGATKLAMGKSAPKSASKQSDSDDEPDIDTSVMRPSIEISVSTVPQLVRAYQAATEELKSILAKECDIIYECRVCRNLFRSLANLMAHKRVYCKTAYCYSKHASNRNHVREDYTVVIQPEPAPSNSEENWTTSDKVPDCSNESNDAEPLIIATTSHISSFTNPKKGLREIVDRLARNTSENSTSSKETKYSSTKQCDNANVLEHTKNQIEHSFQLEDIETSNVGKFQTKLVSTVGSEKDDLMKAQISELQHMASQNEAVLGPDGKMIILSRHSPPAAMKSSVGKISEVNAETHEYKSTKVEHVCPDCNVKFSTRKTLNHHMKSLHVTFRLCYPCPCCKSTFVNPWSVYRHLYKVHRKTSAQVRRLRPQIQRKAFKKEIHNEIPVPETSSKNEALKELQRLDQENQAWMDNFEDDLELQRCGGCGRRFERRAALNSHSQICQKRIAARNNVKVSRNLSTSTSSDKITKVSPTDESSLAIESSKKTNTVNKNIDIGNNMLNAVAASRTHQVASWVEQPKKEIREKKIEIQIRKDYCKMSSASSVVALSNDTQSEPDSRPPSRIVEDEYSYDGDLRDWESVIDVEQANKEQSESDYPLFRDTQAQCTNDDVKEDEDILHANSSKVVRESAVDLNSCISVLNRYSPKKDKFDTHKRPENLLKRRVSDENKSLSNSINSESSKRRRQSLGNENIDKDLNTNLSSKIKKLEQFHPVMEARMKKLINLRRLQCLPCQKKFIKLTNLRRHVAVHIGWCRYKCMLCSFKCFSKYDCVDHVCKIHLKGTQRSKAATMVEYIEEQESETVLDSEQLDELNDSYDCVSNAEDAPEPLSMEINSLNLEDIRNIVGVACYPNVINKSEVSSVTSDEIPVNNISSFENVERNDISLSSDNDKFEIKTVNIKNECISEWNSMTTEAEKYPNDPDATSCSETAEDQKCEDVVSNQTTNVQDETLNKIKKEEILSSENLHKPAIEEKLSPNSELEHVEPFSKKLLHSDSLTESGSCKDIVADKSDGGENISDNESISKDSFDLCNDNKLNDTASEYFSYDEQTNATSQIAVVEEQEESCELVTENENVNNEEYVTAECHAQVQDSEMESIISEEELEPSGKCAVVEESTIASDDICDHDYAVSRDREGEKIADDSLDSSDCAPNQEKDDNALRKMVMEVIFGSGGTSDSHSDPNQNLISISMNGKIPDEDRSEGENSRASSLLDSEVITNNHVSATLKVNKRKNEVECGHGIECEKRERPVRNRVKVEKEDFIYEFPDSFLKKEETSKVGAHNSGSNGSRKKLGDAGKESVKNDFTSDYNRSTCKAVPKLTLVRTDTNEIPGNKRINGPMKGSWSSVYASATDCAGNKTCSESNSQMCSSSRKLPRTYDAKQ